MIHVWRTHADALKAAVTSFDDKLKNSFSTFNQDTQEPLPLALDEVEQALKVRKLAREFSEALTSLLAGKQTPEQPRQSWTVVLVPAKPDV